jgi:hypothetical protein
MLEGYENKKGVEGLGVEWRRNGTVMIGLAPCSSFPALLFLLSCRPMYILLLALALPFVSN